jgi:hypothetical protein
MNLGSGMLKTGESSRWSIDDLKCKSGKQTMMSYGIIKGNYNIQHHHLSTICGEKYFLQNYAFVESKTDYYVLVFDFDFKDKNDKGFVSKTNKPLDIKKDVNEQSVKIVSNIVQYITIVLNEVFSEPNSNYIYCDKNIGHGVHLYYPNIIVNKTIHNEIMFRLYKYLNNDSTYDFSDYVWTKIVDGCVSNANALRLPYFYYNDNFYRYNCAMSTYKMPCIISSVVSKCCVRTDKTECEPSLKITIEPKQKKIKTQNTNTDKNKSAIEMDKFEMFTESVDLVKKLLDVLSVDRLKTYDTWMPVMCLCKNYGMFDMAVKLSKSHQCTHTIKH